MTSSLNAVPCGLVWTSVQGPQYLPPISIRGSHPESELKFSGFSAYEGESEKEEEKEEITSSSFVADDDTESKGLSAGDGPPTNPEFDREFLMSIGTIYKHKTGDVDVKDVQFFTGDYRVEKEKEEKPMTLKDFERHVIVERKGKFEEDEVNAEENGTAVPKSLKKSSLMMDLMTVMMTTVMDCLHQVFSSPKKI
ncbi:protein KRI1 homolog [Macrobrachium nipponense]|uniref:protein KRI1 homolog n=1 Tax=Macrobrachium nipponense TaxID=159736 RepID=UPI0030C7C15E